MKAFHGEQEIKDRYLSRVKAHRLADEIVKGQYWENGKGCAVGCTLHSSNHSAYETELGIPEWLARVEDTIFEGMPIEDSKAWPERFLAAIKPGADLESIKGPFIVFVLESTLANFDHEKYPGCKAAVDGSIALWKRPDIGSAAWSAAWSRDQNVRHEA